MSFQVTWLRLLEHIDRLEQPARVGSWLAATARNECLRALAARQKIVPVPDDLAFHEAAAHQPAVDERLLADERDQTVREALGHLPRQWRRLVEMLMSDPPASYAGDIRSARAAGRQHRPHPRPLPGPAPRPAPSLLNHTQDRPATAFSGPGPRVHSLKERSGLGC